MEKAITLGIIVPCYNEEEVISHTLHVLTEFIFGKIKEGKISPASFVGVVDDRSTDGSWQIIKSFSDSHKHLQAIRFSANRGHQFALLAGLREFNSYADCLVTVDADLQDDISIITTMIERFRQGNEIVYGVRKNRLKDSFLKRVTARGYYKIMKGGLGVNLLEDHADFRLTGRRVNEELLNFKEVNLFLRGIFPLMGFNTAIVHYDRLERTAGKSKYTAGKMLALAFDGITSFSTVPLRIIIGIAFIVFIICVIMMIYAIASYVSGNVVPGWFSTVLPFYFLGGIQILCIGILGEYIGKIYREVKNRPRYIIDERIEKKENDKY